MLKTAAVVLIHPTSGKVGLQLRSSRVQEPHTWAGVGGYIEEGESPMRAAYREIDEELGLNLRRFPMRSVYQDSNHIIYIMEIPNITNFVPKLNWESDDFAWKDPAEWRKIKNIHPALRPLLFNRAFESEEIIIDSDTYIWEYSLDQWTSYVKSVLLDSNKYGPSQDAPELDRLIGDNRLKLDLLTFLYSNNIILVPPLSGEFTSALERISKNIDKIQFHKLSTNTDMSESLSKMIEYSINSLISTIYGGQSGAEKLTFKFDSEKYKEMESKGEAPTMDDIKNIPILRPYQIKNWTTKRNLHDLQIYSPQFVNNKIGLPENYYTEYLTSEQLIKQGRYYPPYLAVTHLKVVDKNSYDKTGKIIKKIGNEFRFQIPVEPFSVCVAAGVDFITGEELTPSDFNKPLIGIHAPVKIYDFFRGEYASIVQATTITPDEYQSLFLSDFCQDDTDFALRNEYGMYLTRGLLDFPFTEEEYRRYILQYYMENEAGLSNIQGRCRHQDQWNRSECEMGVIVGTHPAFEDYGIQWEEDEFYCENHITSDYDGQDLGMIVPMMYADEIASKLNSTY